MSASQDQLASNDSLSLLDIELSANQSTVEEILSGIDEMLALTSGHQIVSASEMADKLLDLRLLVSQFQSQEREPRDESTDNPGPLETHQ